MARYFTSKKKKCFCLGMAEELQLGRKGYFIERKEKVGRGCFEQVHCRETEIQGGDGFSLAERLLVVVVVSR